MAQHKKPQWLRGLFRSSRPADDSERATRNENPASVRGTEAVIRTNTASSSEITSTPAAKSSLSLWDIAYEKQRVKDRQLIDEYEECLSRQLTSPPQTLGQPQLEEIAQMALAHVEKNRLKIKIFGTEYVIHSRVADLAKALQPFKDITGQGLKASPEASAAWAGVCVILPLLSNPDAAQEVISSGLDHIASSIQYYVAFEPKLAQIQMTQKELMAGIEAEIVELYRQIIAFQVQCVLHLYSHWVKRVSRDVTNPDKWKEMLDGIEKQDNLVCQRLRQVHDSDIYQSRKDLKEEAQATLGLVWQLLCLSKTLLNRAITDEEDKCLQIFLLGTSDRDTSYEWQKYMVKEHTENTCQWFLEHLNFQHWLAQDAGPLLFTADPGCGKSVLTKFLIDHKLAGPAKVFYFFFKNQDQESFQQALCALIHQILRAEPTLIEHALGPYRQYGPTIATNRIQLMTICTKLLEDQRIGQVIIVLDALDECREGDLKVLIYYIKDIIMKLGSTSGIKFLMSSRPYEQVVGHFNSLRTHFPNIRISGEEHSDAIMKEVSYVITARMKQLAAEQQLSSELQDYILQRLLKMTHRTYLWVHLVFDYLGESLDTIKRTRSGLDKELADIPPNVDAAYESILSRSRDKDFAKKAFSIVLAARRPLCIGEMNIAMAIGEDTLALEDLDREEDKDFKRRLRECCGLFLSIQHNRVYFLHQTAKEFLTANNKAPTTKHMQWKHCIDLNECEGKLAWLCTTVLGFKDEWSAILALNKQIFWFQRLQEHCESDIQSFMVYAAEYWPSHSRENQNSLELDHLARFFDPREPLQHFWFALYWRARTDGALKAPYVNKLQLAALLGHERVLSHVVQSEQKPSIDDTDSNGRTALIWASEKGHEKAVWILLEEGANVNAQDETEHTALICASAEGHENVVKILLENGADINARNEDGTNALQAASMEGHERVVLILLERGADVKAQGGGFGDALQAASTNGHEKVVLTLLNKGANVNAQGGDFGNALQAASWSGHEKVVLILLERGANVNAQGGKFSTAMQAAKETGEEKIAQMLWDRGAFL